ncbi:hypothetical protein [Streptomyces sp. NPDC014894]|uniref:hypothetical protein n=1 Tax=Streptomyces sp. NPDC014894 TaxID=3364931 RepID=UPI0036FB6F0F
MAVHPLPSERDVFARYLRGLTALLDQDTGWYAVFARRDPEGMRECLDGVEVPPWDVVEALLHDLAAARGAQFAAREEDRARRLHTTAAAVYDRRPGGRAALAERVELMRQELIQATLRAEELIRRLTVEPARTETAARLEHELEWTRDDQARATARLAELRSRLASLTPASGPPQHPGERDAGPREGWFRPGRDREAAPAAPAPEPSWRRAAGPEAAPPAERPRPGAPSGARADRPGAPRPRAENPGAPRPRTAGPGAPSPSPYRGEPPLPAPRSRERGRAEPPEREPERAAIPEPAGADGRAPRRGLLRGARFAGAAQQTDARDTAVAAPPTAAPEEAPRGARHAPAPDHPAVHAPDPDPDHTAPAAEAPASAGHASETAHEVVRTLARLRTEERGGEAHAVLCEAAVLPAAWLPVLAGELHRAGLDADWTTLLWEAASQPLPRVTAIAGALAAEGREEDGERLLRQGVSRPADEIAAAALDLAGQGRAPEAHALLTACVQLHSAADAARIASGDPRRLVPLLLTAARAQSRSHEHRLVHALRVAGHLAT